MTDRCEMFRNCRTTIPLSSLKISTLYTIICDFYASPNAQNRMCELCTFSQIRLHILVASSKLEAEEQKQMLCSVFNKLKVPLETSKLKGPATCQSFLGIEVDTSLRQLRLPVEKLMKLKAELAQCVFHKLVTKRELQSLTGLLQFATKVICPGRPFLHQLYALQDIGSHPDHYIPMNQAGKADILWWHLFTDK